jgi:hypothetical protein
MMTRCAVVLVLPTENCRSSLSELAPSITLIPRTSSAVGDAFRQLVL